MKALLRLGSLLLGLVFVTATQRHFATAQAATPEIVHGGDVDYIGYKHATLDQDVFRGKSSFIPRCLHSTQR